MEMSKNQTSAGILAYRIGINNTLEVFLVKPGGPYITNETKWGIPKGHIEKYDKKIVDTAIREFKEEVGYEFKISKKQLIDLGEAKQNKNKIIYIWAYKLDLGDEFIVKSNLTKIEYPKNSNQFIDIPEISEGKYFQINEAVNKIVPGQIPILHRLTMFLSLQ